ATLPASMPAMSRMNSFMPGLVASGLDGLLAGAAFVVELLLKLFLLAAQQGDDPVDDGTGGQEDEFAHGLSPRCVDVRCSVPAGCPGGPAGKLADPGAGRSVEQAGDEGDGAAGDGEGDGDGGCGHADGGGTDAQGARGGAADEGAGAGGHGGATCADLGAAGDDLGQFVAGQADGDGFGDGHGVLSFLCGVMGSLPKRWMQCAGGGGREWVWQACQCGGGDAAERL